MRPLWKLSPRDFGSDNPKVVELLRAVVRNDPDRIRLAASEGANPNEVGSKGLTPLLFSLMYPKNVEAIRALVLAGADPNAGPKDLPDPMTLASGEASGVLLKLFLELGASPNPPGGIGQPYTAAAVYALRFRNYRLLIESGADINAYVDPHSPLVSFLIELGHWELADDLLEKGALSGPVATSEIVRSVIKRHAPARGSAHRLAFERVVDRLGVHPVD